VSQLSWVSPYQGQKRCGSMQKNTEVFGDDMKHVIMTGLR
jgi:hypothetical protein